VANDGSFLVEDFLGAITSQLDRTQDALALKAVNRPLTYAIKDFSLELKVFVEVDPEGRVRFRSPGANEPGASSVSIGFTTITRPMIEENTVEMSAARTPTLASSGLSDVERQRLERIGVRNTAELQRLRQSAGTDGLARLADIPVDRLRHALTLGRPQIRDVRPVPAPARPSRPPAPPAPPAQVPPPAPPAHGPPPAQVPPPAPPAQGPPPRVPPAPRPPAPRPPAPRPPVAPRPKVVTLPPATRRIEVVGRNLLGPQGAPSVRLGGVPLTVAEADDGRFVVELPPEALGTAATLEVDAQDGEQPLTYEIAPADPWAPVES
jgi:hypothetical protein